MGDISLGCWTDSQQVNQATASNTADNSPADGMAQSQGCSMAGVTNEAQQPSTAEGCGAMDLTNYFATLPNEVVAFTDLVMPSPVSSDFVSVKKTQGLLLCAMMHPSWPYWCLHALLPLLLDSAYLSFVA